MHEDTEKYYLNIGKASDLKDAKERIIYRILEIIPGALIWLTLIGMFVSSWLFPTFTAIFIIIFCVYWLVRVSHFALHLVAAYRQMKKNMQINWQEKLVRLPGTDWQKIYHLVILPTYKEEIGVLRGSLQALVQSQYPKDKMIVILSIEERAGNEVKERAQKLSEEFGDKFFKFLVTCHPAGIADELAGKGSNESWAGREAKRQIIDPLGIPYSDIIVSCFDSDTQVYPHYFCCLTYHYLTEPKAARASFQPVPFYFNNVFEAPFFSRVVSASNVFWQMMQQQRPEKLTTYSSHSMGFQTLVDVDFWQTNIVSEDAGIFWRALLFYDGDYEIVPFHYPLSMDSCAAKSWKQTIINQYKQQRRWAWGSEGIPYLLFGFFKNKKIAFHKKFRYTLLLLESFWAWGTNALLILFLGWLPLLLGGGQFNSTILSYNLPKTTQILMTAALGGVIVCIIINSVLFRLASVHLSQKRKLSMVAQWIFLPVSLIIFGSLPAIDAQTRLMFGKYMGFWATPKDRK